MAQYLEKSSPKKSKNYQSKIIGIILILLGFCFLYITPIFDYKLSGSLIFIGFIIILLISGKKTREDINDIQLTFFIIIIILAVLLITIDADFEIFILLLIIGVIALKEFIEKFLWPHLQKRLNILIYSLLILFVIVIVKRIINISSMYPR
jgi:hypothetical protein